MKSIKKADNIRKPKKAYQDSQQPLGRDSASRMEILVGLLFFYEDAMTPREELERRIELHEQLIKIYEKDRGFAENKVEQISVDIKRFREAVYTLQTELDKMLNE